MKKNRTKIFNLFLIVCLTLVMGTERASASHSAGADLTYHSLGGGCYVVTMTFYRDCYGIAAPTSFPCTITSTCGTLSATLLPITGTGQEITRPCPGQTTTCSGGTAAGIQKWVYEAQVCGITPCADWVFSTTMCCRNAAITTLVSASSYNLYVEARLNNVLVASDNSPQFSVDPIVFVCVGQNFTYNQGAIDADGDSLVYALIAPRTDASTNVTYATGFNPFSPITSVPPVALNSVTGDIVMHATVAGQVGVMAVLVQDFRNGVLIGSVVRDIQIYTVACNNQLPTASGINGTTNFAVIQCAGSTVHFTINSADLDAGQTVTMTWNSGIGAPATFVVTTASRPVGTFNWVTTAANARSQPYTFTVTVRDNNCPSTGAQVYSYSVTIHALTVAATSTPVACNGGATGSATATAAGTGGPYTYVWSPGGVVGQTRNNMAAGTYTVVATDAGGCNTSTTVVVTQPSPLVVSASTTPQTCSGLGGAVINVTGGTAPYTYSLNTNPARTTSVITGLAAGTYVETVRDAKGCRSTYNVVIANQGGSLTSTQSHTNELCNGGATASASVTAAGGSGSYTYSWSPSGGNAATANNLAAGTYVVTIASGACTSTQTIVVTQPAAINIALTWSGEHCLLLDAWCQSNVTGGTAPYTYAWTAWPDPIVPPINNSSLVNQDEDTMRVVVTDANGCVAANQVWVPSTATDPLHIPDPIVGPATVCAGQTGISFSVPYQWQAFNYTWSVPAGATIVSGQGSVAGAIVVNWGTAPSGNVTVFATNCESSAHSPSPTRTKAITRNCREAGELDVVAESFSVYPNPAHDKINVSISGIANQEIRVELSDILGKIIFMNAEKSDLNYLNTIDISNLSSGIYMLKIQYMNEVKTVKVVRN